MTAVDSEQKPEAARGAPEEAGPGPAGPQPAAEPAAPAAPAAPEEDAAQDERGNVVVGIGVAVTLLGLLVLGFVAYLYWLSGLQEARAQTGMYANLRAELAAAWPRSDLPPPGRYRLARPWRYSTSRRSGCTTRSW